MEIKTFTKILKDKAFVDYKKMKYKYGADFDAFLKTLEELYYKTLPILDFDDGNVVFIENHAMVSQNIVKLLLKEQNQDYGIKAAEEEIIATSAIESIDFSRDSVRNILKGMAPKDENETRIMGLKKGLEFIADPDNKISEKNLYKLYMMTIGDFLEKEDSLPKGSFYRNDAVYVVGDGVEHTGLSAKKVPEFMKSLIEFANAEDDINELIKAAIIHFYLAFVHLWYFYLAQTTQDLWLCFLHN